MEAIEVWKMALVKVIDNLLVSLTEKLLAMYVPHGANMLAALSQRPDIELNLSAPGQLASRTFC